MLLAFVMPIQRRSEADEFARELLTKLTRWLLLIVGALVVLAGILISPLPGPGGIPVIDVRQSNLAPARRLTGSLRDYSTAGFPYTTPNFVFFGDNTFSAAANSAGGRGSESLRNVSAPNWRRKVTVLTVRI